MEKKNINLTRAVLEKSKNRGPSVGEDLMCSCVFASAEVVCLKLLSDLYFTDCYLICKQRKE